VQLRQIPKNPTVPPLNEQAISLLTMLCFREDNEGFADAMFIFGTRTSMDKQASVAIDLLSKYQYSNLILTGGIPLYDGTPVFNKTEADLLHAELKQHIPTKTKLFLEKSSTNTLENVTKTIKIHDLSQHEKIIFITKSFAAGRAYLTLRKYLPQCIIIQKTYDPTYLDDKLIVSRSDWHDAKEGRARVWSEFLRIKHYGQRDDIAYKEISSIVEEIEQI
jgi:hypothetical protein